MSIEGPNATRSHSIEALREINRKWQKDGVDVECTEDEKYAAITPLNLEGMQLTKNYSFKRKNTISVSFNNSDNVREKLRHKIIEGSREVDFTKVEEIGEQNIVSKSTTGTELAKMEVKNNRGIKRYLERTYEVSDTPFKTEIYRNKDDLKDVEKRIIKEGVLNITGKEGAKMILSFNEVEMITEDGCKPVSGTISGEFYQSGSDTADRTFTIDFASEEVTFNDGKIVDFTPDGCWMQRRHHYKPIDVATRDAAK